MARSTFKVLFYLKRQSERDGAAPIMGRITVNGTIAQFSCKLSIAPRLWDVKANKAAGKSTVAQRINEKLDKIRALIIKQYDRIAATDNFVSAEKVKNAYLGFGDEYRTLLSVAEEFLDEYGKRVGKDRTPGSYEQQCINHKRIVWFLRNKYSLSDIPLREIEPSFIEDFHYYLTVTRSLASGTVIGAITKLKQLILYSIRKRYISCNPFMGFRCTAQYRDRGFLTEEELQTFMHAELRRYKQRQVRDIFVFCCFTGLSYSDVKKLTFDHIKTSFDGDSWIIAHRQKTGTPFHIKLLPVAKQLIENYRPISKNNLVFPVPSVCDNMNRTLQRIARDCGLKKHITMHMSRHTFATTVTLSQGVPLETVSQMLGHTNILTTQIYAKITNEKISRDMSALTERLGDKYRLAE